MLEFRKRVRLGDVLIEKGLITQEQLEKALSEQKEKGTLLGETLVNLGYVSQDNIIDILTEQLGVEYVDLRKYEIEEDAVHLISEPIARKYRLIPIAISKKAANVLIVAMADPMDIMAIDDVSIVTNMQVEPVLSTSEAIEFFLDKAFGKQQASAIAEQFKKEQGEVWRKMQKKHPEKKILRIHRLCSWSRISLNRQPDREPVIYILNRLSILLK